MHVKGVSAGLLCNAQAYETLSPEEGGLGTGQVFPTATEVTLAGNVLSLWRLGQVPPTFSNRKSSDEQ